MHEFTALVRAQVAQRINRDTGWKAGQAVDLAQTPNYTGKKAARAIPGVYGFEVKGRRFFIVKASETVSRALRSEGVLTTGQTLRGWVAIEWRPFSNYRLVYGGFRNLAAVVAGLKAEFAGVRY